MASNSAIKLLANSIKRLTKDPVEGFLARVPDESNMFRWDIFIEGPQDTPYEGGIFKLDMRFPQDYPMSPPTLRFVSDFWHPNVYPDGRVCISILHPPGDDMVSGELASERWLPTQTVRSVLLSVISMLNDPNCSSPANVDASVEWRKSRAAYIKRCATLVAKSKSELPDDVVIPHPDTNPSERKPKEAVEEEGFQLYDDYGEVDFDDFDDCYSGSDFGSDQDDDGIWDASDDGEMDTGDFEEDESASTTAATSAANAEAEASPRRAGHAGVLAMDVEVASSSKSSSKKTKRGKHSEAKKYSKKSSSSSLSSNGRRTDRKDRKGKKKKKSTKSSTPQTEDQSTSNEEEDDDLLAQTTVTQSKKGSSAHQSSKSSSSRKKGSHKSKRHK